MPAGCDGLPIKKTNGKEKADFGTILLKAGDNKIRYACHKNQGMKIDYFLVSPDFQ